VSAADVDLRALASGHVHFVGVGGAGMCALAELLLRSGGTVSGCDVKDSPSLRHLARLGATVHVGHDPAHVEGASALIVTAAMRPDHPELEAARALGTPVVKRATALGAWVAPGTVVAIAGSHGKTTTTAMATEILAAAGRDPTGLVGGHVTGWEGNLRFGGDALFVVEADEYDRSFHTLTPDVAVVTSLDADHLDVYGDLAGVREGFLRFLECVRDGGRVIVCADDHGASSLAPSVAAHAYTYGTSAGSMLRATDVVVSAGSTRCTVVEEGRRVGALTLAIGGRHNLLNALGAAAAARALGAEWAAIERALAAFRGVSRRFELVGRAEGVVVIDDYAHHPTEIAATLAAARAMFPESRMVAVFQPHLYSRTRDLADEFGRALATADVVWVTDVFPAREAPIPGVTGALVADAARAHGAREVRYVAELEEVPAALAGSLRPGDLLLTLGAGSVGMVGPAVLGGIGASVHA